MQSATKFKKAGRLAIGLVLMAGATGWAPAAAQAQPSPTSRQLVQHILRRFAFSAAPETVTAVLNQPGGWGAWLTQQTNWAAIDDSATAMQPLPTAPPGHQRPYEGRIFEHMIETPRQLQAKLELHWLDHFSLNQGVCQSQACFYSYDLTVRANALGNFAQLLSAVSIEPGMLLFLNNNNNKGDKPNQNFAREVMQLYSMGLEQLNPDGSLVLDANGKPVPTFTAADVEAMARAMTGYLVKYDATADINAPYSVSYLPGNHNAGPFHFLGADRMVPTDGTAIAYIAKILAHQPSTAPFQVRELLQRFVTETPSPAYISRVVQVWTAAVNAPDQIAQVIRAIVTDPEFAASYHSMTKQIVETTFGAARQLPAMVADEVAATQSFVTDFQNAGQDLAYPANVFSFYTPGHVETLMQSQSLLALQGTFDRLANGTATTSGTWIDVPTLLARVGASDGASIAAYLLDATLDGGTPAMQALLTNYLGATPDARQIEGAIWIILSSASYQVN